MFNIFRDTIAKDLTKIADYFNGVADAGTIFKDKRSLAVNRIKNAVLNGDIGGGGGVTPEIEAEIENAQWKTETSTPLFSETVTTVDEGDTNEATLSYAEQITADTLKITFNGVEYTCTKRTIEDSDDVHYGAPYNSETEGFDFSEYPFNILSSPLGGNIITTETPGTYTVSASAETVTYTDTFKKGVHACAFKEVETLGEADIAVVTVTRRVASANQATNFTIYMDDNDGIQFIASSANKYLVDGVYYFWKDNSNTLSNFGYRLSPSNDGLLVMDNAEIDTTSSASILNVNGTAVYALTSSNASWKFYNIGLTLSSDGDGGDAPK